jgi:hypothetical protein
MASSNDDKPYLAMPGSGLFLQLVLLPIVFSSQIQQSYSQSVSVTINSPPFNMVAHENLYVSVQVTSTYQLQSCQAFVEDRTNQLTSSPPYWIGTLSLAGLARGNKVLTVVATDVFGNSNQAQRSFVYDLPPTLSVTAPPNGTVVRSNLHVTASANDDGPTPPIIDAVDQSNFYARGTNTLDTNIFLADGQALTLTIRATDSLGQTTNITRQVYVVLSSNLVEVARVSAGEIRDMDGDRILFVSNNGSTNLLMNKSRSTGTENVVYQTTDSVGITYLTPSGVAFEAPMNDSSLTRVYEDRNGSLLDRGPLGDGAIVRKGNFLFWGNGFLSSIFVGDLLTTTTTTITNNLGGYNNFFHSDGTILLTGGVPSHSIVRYRAGVFSVLASDPNTYFDHPQTDGSNVCCIIFPPGGSTLVFLTNGTTSKIADTPIEYQMNNGWIVYTRDAGTGAYQIWRRAPDGTTVQLTFYGTSSTVGALAPNGEVAFYNNSHLYISKGSWPPADVGLTSGNYLGPYLTPFWQNGCWYARIGGSLFRINTGSPQIISPQATANAFSFEIVGAIGQHVVSQSSTDLVHWTDFATNNIADGASMGVTDTGLAGVPAKYYRLKLQ